MSIKIRPTISGNDYQEAAMRTADTEKKEDLILNGVLGICGEGGEIADIIKKVEFQGHWLNRGDVAYELGDLLWYCAILAKGIGYDLETVMRMNIEKLKERYPDGFDPDRSINRETGKKIYTVKIRDKETGESQAFTFQKPESVESCIDIYSAIGKEIFVESRERMAGE